MNTGWIPPNSLLPPNSNSNMLAWTQAYPLDNCNHLTLKSANETLRKNSKIMKCLGQSLNWPKNCILYIVYIPRIVYCILFIVYSVKHDIPLSFGMINSCNVEF